MDKASIFLIGVVAGIFIAYILINGKVINLQITLATPEQKVPKKIKTLKAGLDGFKPTIMFERTKEEY